MHKEQERTHLRVTGRVQRVGFRWFVTAEARRLGLHGWVRNNADGSVELEAAGEADALQALRARVAKGPPAARVESITDLPVGSDPLPARFDSIR